jgi:hypothetical protein
MASIKNHSSDLYERDYYAWLQNQVQALRDHRIEDVDWENIAEEIEDLGWRVSIKSAPRQIRELLKESPSLRSQLAQMLLDAYDDGRIEALRKPRLTDDILPETSPWTLEQMMDDSLPGQSASTRG